MALAAKLQLRQAQSLVMTPQLMQSIRLLQFTHAELERFIDEEIERNPLLERDGGQDDAFHGEEAAPPDGAKSETGEEGEWFRDDLDGAAKVASQFDSSLENVFPDDPGIREAIAPQLAANWKSGNPVVEGGEGFDLEDVTAAAATLRDHVAEQISFCLHQPGDRMIAVELADALDESGYLQIEFDELTNRLSVERARITAVLKTCRTFDPPGIFARDLSECLALQLARKDRFDPAMAALIANLDLLARRDFQALKKICGVAEDDLLDMLAEIKALDPKPGAAFVTSGMETIVPDVVVQPAPDGTWTVELNPASLPRVLVNQTYFAHVSGHARDAGERQFLSDCLQSANWLTRSLDQRARTILKVTSEIVRQQDAFLTSGVEHLRPLNLRMVADAIQMHESTVSRVTANKYVQTPRGLFELRYFFTASLGSAMGGEAHSAEAVRHRIRQMIEEETAAEILSDDAIVDILRKTGIDIARRTVAKYREGMSIPSSVQRRREKRALATAGR
ncbi:RNA polymerase factor sigma-54 [Mesorhizobium xinjiangense]|uniref:RNA polymerase factor sigma-54 n=1 Tax=Mesorhizobium xinjiangense TaxID=2678685 RepID=UPI0012ED7531|nr:RNA polymerase factor sigma-54 [Mesorhizobium xinjiangense]